MAKGLASEIACISGISPGPHGEPTRGQTGEPFITSEVLYQLSYVGGAGCRQTRPLAGYVTTDFWAFPLAQRGAQRRQT